MHSAVCFLFTKSFAKRLLSLLRLVPSKNALKLPTAVWDPLKLSDLILRGIKHNIFNLRYPVLLPGWSFGS